MAHQCTREQKKKKKIKQQRTASATVAVIHHTHHHHHHHDTPLSHHQRTINKALALHEIIFIILVCPDCHGVRCCWLMVVALRIYDLLIFVVVFLFFLSDINGNDFAWGCYIAAAGLYWQFVYDTLGSGRNGSSLP